MTSSKQPRRPAMWDPVKTAHIAGGADPADAHRGAYACAEALVKHGRAATDPAVHERLMRLVEREGIDIIAPLWQHTAPSSLPGALWRLYLLREWIIRDADQVAELYTRGAKLAEVADTIAGMPLLQQPADVRATIDAIFTGVFTGDLDVAFDRAGALYRVLAAGWQELHEASTRATRLATTGMELHRAAKILRHQSE